MQKKQIQKTNSPKRVITITVVRNEEQNLAKVLAGLAKQESPSLGLRSIVVNDGSQDNTGSIAENTKPRPKHTHVIHMPDRGFSAIGTGLLSLPYNAAAKMIKKQGWKPDYLMLIPGDLVCPSGYILSLVNNMEKDRKIAIGGSKPANYYQYATTPGGPGRIIRGSFWRYFGGEFPKSAAWEAGMLYQSTAIGYKNVILPPMFHQLRKEGAQMKNYQKWGVVMKEMGCQFLLLAGRITKALFIGTRTTRTQTMHILVGYLRHNYTDETIAPYVRKAEKIRLKQFISGFLPGISSCLIGRMAR